MYKFKVEYYVKYKNFPQKSQWLGVTAANFCDAQNQSIKILKKQYPTSYWNIWQITKTIRFVGTDRPVKGDRPVKAERP